MVPMEDGTWEIGYHIAKAYTGNGYATEAVKAFLPVMAKKVGARKVYGICLSENIASKKVLNKCGFEFAFEGVGNYQGKDREIYKSVWRKKDFEYEIIDLPKKEWKGTRIPLDYTTETYYDVETTAGPEGFNIDMKKKKFDTPVTHKSEDYDFPDGLYQDHWEKAEAYGIVKKENGEKKLMACIEICPEEWSNRLMVTELWVADELHRQGIGTRLMNLAKEKAKEQGRRAIILETQSCNTRAIAFYLSQGFELIGFDSCCYTNRDIERQEVRFNLGFFMDRRDGRF